MLSKNHYFFNLSASSWALVASLSLFNLMFSLMVFMKFFFLKSLLVSLFFTTFSSMMWWIFYSKEFILEGKESFSLEQGVKFSMILFISSEIFFFFAFFWSYFHFFLAPNMEVSLSWPPMLVESFEFTKVPLVNTLILLSSGISVTLSHKFLNSGKNKLCIFFLVLTIIFGVIFTIFQKMEYSNSFFSISDSTFGTSFFMLTGFHGLHVIIGTFFLIIVLLRMFFISCSKMDSISFELSSWYWHFVDVVWIFLYFCLYYITS